MSFVLLPLPSGERAGVRGRARHSGVSRALTPTLSQREREPIQKTLSRHAQASASSSRASSLGLSTITSWLDASFTTRQPVAPPSWAA